MLVPCSCRGDDGDCLLLIYFAVLAFQWIRIYQLMISFVELEVLKICLNGLYRPLISTVEKTLNVSHVDGGHENQMN